jgi:hypothetical protein
MGNLCSRRKVIIVPPEKKRSEMTPLERGIELEKRGITPIPMNIPKRGILFSS